MIRDRDTLTSTPARELALDCIEAGIEAADPARVLGERLGRDGSTLRIDDETVDLAGFERVIVVGGGKAGGSMAASLDALLGDVIETGLVVATEATRHGSIEVAAGDHPVPSDRGVAATRRALSLVDVADADTLVLVPISGGGSALLPAPAGDVTLADLQAVTNALLDSGATIHEINAVRKHLSAIKGGRLAARARPATVHTLLVSDVVGDDPSVIASGPTVPDPSTYTDALAVLETYGIDPPTAVADRLAAGQHGDRPETPGPEDAAFERVSNHLLADGGTAARAARVVAADAGYTPLLLSTRIRGESREAALTHVAVAEEIRATGEPVAPPAVVVSAGETTVTIRGEGTGGPNQEFALRAAVDLKDGVTLAAVDTDGIDGASEAAGAIVDVGTVDDRRAALAALAENDASPYLRDRDALLVTGETGTNVNDLRVVIVEP